MKNKEPEFPFRIFRDGKWLIASCPSLDIAAQGKTRKEAEENIRDLISEYLKDPDTIKPASFKGRFE